MRAKAARAWLERQGVDEAQAETFAREALGVIEDQRFAAVFGPKSRAEAPIIGEAAGKSVRGVVDRLVVDDNRVIILDFKTDRFSSTFVFNNPNQVSACGCGESVELKPADLKALAEARAAAA